jgi:hypothetical protein
MIIPPPTCAKDQRKNTGIQQRKLEQYEEKARMSKTKEKIGRTKKKVLGERIAAVKG